VVARRIAEWSATLIDMHVPPGGGPPPHRHDFEEMFSVLDGKLRVTFRARASSSRPARPSACRPTRQGDPAASVADIARRAAAGDSLAIDMLATAHRTLGATLATYIRAFQAEVLVIGGGMSAAWPIIEPPLQRDSVSSTC
jgi:predicted NBD/HSP70 family sugar kinase